jgi:hypothetical protein
MKECKYIEVETVVAKSSPLDQGSTIGLRDRRYRLQPMEIPFGLTAHDRGSRNLEEGGHSIDEAAHDLAGAISGDRRTRYLTCS